MWTTSQELSAENGAAVNAFDGNPKTIWHTEWSRVNKAGPHEIRIDLGNTYSISGFKYLPRPTTRFSWSHNGRIAKYALYVGTSPTNLGAPVATGTFGNDGLEKTVNFSARSGRYVRLVALSEVNGNPWASAAEINLLTAGSPTTGGTVPPTTGSTSSGTNTYVPTVAPTSSDATVGAEGGDAIDWRTLVGNAVGTVYSVSSVSQFDSVAAAVRPGDVVLFENGTYRGTLHVKSNGTATRPIIYTARNPGKVVFDGGDRMFVITGQHNIIGGFVIKNVTSRVFHFTGPTGYGTVGASNNRITDNLILRSGSPNNSTCRCWMVEFQRRSSNNRLDHNVFRNNYGFIRVVVDDESLKYGLSAKNRIDHNVIADPMPSTGSPAIQLGGSGKDNPASAKVDVGTLVENNLFKNYNNGGRIVTVKSSGNIIRNNTIHGSNASIELRYANRTQVVGNYFGKGSKGAISVNGAGHVISGNTIESPTNDHILTVFRSGERAAAPGAPLLPTHDIIVSNNYISGFTRYALGVNLCHSDACDPVYNITVTGNILRGTQWRLFHYNSGGARNHVIKGNVYLASGTAEYGEGYDADAQPLTSVTRYPPLPALPVLSSWALSVSGV